MHQIDGSGRFTSLVGVVLLLLTAHVAGIESTSSDRRATPLQRSWVDAPAPPARSTDQVTVQAPLTVTPGTRFVVRVQLPTRGRRHVELQERLARGWRVIATSRTNARGRAALQGYAGPRPGARTFRVRAPRSRAFRALVSGKQRIDVRDAEPAPIDDPEQPEPTDTPEPTEGPAPTAEPEPTGPSDVAYDPAETLPVGAGLLGSATDWRWLHEAGTGRWDPCTVIRWRYNPAGGYAGSLTDLTRAFARVAGITGLRFKYVGTTDLVPAADVRAADAEVLVGWAGLELPAFQRGAIGVGGNTMFSITGRDVAYEVARGFVLLNRGARLPIGFAVGGDPTWGQAMVHEVLHVVGLGHAQGADQLMAPTITSRNHLPGAGDVAGAVRVGASRGCLS